MIFCFFEAFGGKFTENLFFGQKLVVSERSTEILRKFVFLNMFEKRQTLRKIWISLNNSFCSNI